MMLTQSPYPGNESARRRVLYDIDLLDTAPETEFDRITDLMRATFSVDIAMIALLDDERLWVKSIAGAEIVALPRQDTFCNRVVETVSPLVVSDLTLDPNFSENPFVCGAPNLRFYAGVPLMADGQAVGTVCLLGYEPRSFTEEDTRRLTIFSDIVADIVRVRRIRIAHENDVALLSKGPVAMLTWHARPGWPLEHATANIMVLLGLESAEPATFLEVPFQFDRFVHPEDRGSLRQVLSHHERIAATTPLELDYRLVGPNKRTVWVRQFSRGEFDATGRLRRVRGLLIEQTEQKQLEMQIKSTLERFKLALDAGALGTWDCHLPSGTMTRSQRWASLLGLSSDEVEPSLPFWRASINPLDRPAVDKAWQDHLQGKTAALEVEYRTRDHEGQEIWLHSYGRIIETGINGEPVRIVGTTRNVTHRRQQQQQQEKQRQLLELLNQAQQTFLLEKDMRGAAEVLLEPIIKLSESQFGFIGEVFRDDSDGHQFLAIRAISDIAWDDASTALYRLHADGNLAFHNLDNLFGSTVLTARPVVANAVSEDPRSRGVPAGHPVIESFLGLPIMFGGEVLGMIGLANRLEGYDDALLNLLQPLPPTLGLLMNARRLEQARQQAEAELKRLARYDELTGIFNRRAFMDAADHVFAGVRRHQRIAHVAIIDLDNFKTINDTYGHAAGDEVLRAFAAVMKAMTRDTDVFGRVGGEEFALILVEAGALDVTAVLDRMRTAIATSPVIFEDQEIAVTVSMGVAVLDPEDTCLETCLARADGALYTAKREGRNRVVLAAD